MNVKRLPIIMVVFSLASGCLKDKKDEPIDHDNIQNQKGCTFSSDSALRGCWKSSECELFDEKLHSIIGGANGFYVREGFAVDADHKLTSTFHTYNDSECNIGSGAGFTRSVYTVNFDSDFINSNGLESSIIKLEGGQNEKITYFYKNGQEVCFPEGSFMLHGVARGDLNNYNELEKGLDFNFCFTLSDKI